RLCALNASNQPACPKRRASWVDPSMSVNRNVAFMTWADGPAAVDAGVCPIPECAVILRQAGVERPPQKAASDGPVRPPWLGNPLHLLRQRERIEAVAVLDRPSDPEVSDRQHIGSLEMEHQEHVGAPYAEPADRNQFRDH